MKYNYNRFSTGPVKNNNLFLILPLSLAFQQQSAADKLGHRGAGDAEVGARRLSYQRLGDRLLLHLEVDKVVGARQVPHGHTPIPINIHLSHAVPHPRRC